MQDVRIAIVGGGSRLWRRSIAPDLCRFSYSPLSGKIALYDVDPKMAEEAREFYQLYNQAGGGKWTIEAAKSLDEALEGADFVLVTFNHGGLRGTEIDLMIPARFGIPQTVGDTVGPGGLSRALRNIPAIVDVAQAMQKHCPSAFLLNLSNPMTVMCMAAARFHDPSRVIGYCHEWGGLEHHLRKTLDIPEGTLLSPVIFGLNHFSAVFGLFEVKDDQITPSLDNVVSRLQNVEQPRLTDSEYETISPFSNRRRVIRELAIRYGILPIAGDRHVIEFLPGDWLTREMLREYEVKITSFEDRRQGAEKLAEESLRFLDQKGPLAERHSGEEIEQIISALAGTRESYLTNIVVDGTEISRRWKISGMPFDPHCFYEASCAIGKVGIQPGFVIIPELPKIVDSKTGPADEFKHLTRVHAQICLLVVDNVLLSERHLLEDALVLDPLTGRFVKSYGEINQLLSELIERNKMLIFHPLLEKL